MIDLSIKVLFKIKIYQKNLQNIINYSTYLYLIKAKKNKLHMRINDKTSFCFEARLCKNGFHWKNYVLRNSYIHTCGNTHHNNLCENVKYTYYNRNTTRVFFTFCYFSYKKQVQIKIVVQKHIILLNST